MSKFSKAETDEGTAIVKSFLDTWKAQTSDAADVSEEQQVEALRRVAESFKGQFEASPWIQELMQSF